MSGGNNSPAPTRYAGIQVQTSSLGIQIPVGWGTFRCRCNLVDYLDFNSVAQKASSGKGGSTTTGYSYSATIILALCEGPIDTITQVWVDGKNYAYDSNGSGVANTANASAASQVGLTGATGTVGQAVWSYLTSAHPSHAIGYSGLAIAYAENYPLDSGASTPSHNFEVVRVASYAVGGGYTGPDIDPSLMLADFFQNTRTGVPSWPSSGLLDGVSLSSAANSYQKYCLASGLLISPVIDEERSAADFLNEILLATNSTVVWSEGLLKFIPYGDTAVTGNGVTYTPNLTPVYSLDDDQFIVKKAGDDPITVTIEDQSEAYNAVQMEYLDRTNQYSMAIAFASDAANVAQYGRRLKDPDTVHVICTPSVAAIAGQLWLQRTLYIRTQYTFKLSWAFALLEPGDLLELTDSGLGLSAYMVRIIQIDEDEKDGTLDITCEDLLVGVSHSPLYTLQTTLGTQINQAVDPGGVEANLLTYSQDWTQSFYSTFGLTVTAAAATDPVYGATTAQKFTPSTASSTHGVQTASGVSIFAGANYTYTVYLAADGYTKATINLTDNGSNAAQITVDLSAGQVTATSVSGSAMMVSSSISAAISAGGNTWYRCQISAVFPFGVTAIYPQIYVLNASGAQTYAGNGSSAILAFGAQLTQGVDIRTYTTTAGSIAGPILFNPPSALTSGGNATWAAVSGGPNWAGCNVWVSLDGGSTYAQVGTMSGGPCRYGQLTASFASGSDPDTTDTCAVDISASNRFTTDANGQLDSAADAVADQAGSLCLILDPAGSVAPELISFSTATLTAQCRYNLTSYIRRGQLKTTISSHSAGAQFIRLDSAIFDFPYLAPVTGNTVYVKFQSINQWGRATTPLGDCRAYSFVPAALGSAAPGSSAWSATAGTLSNGGQTVPAIFVTGSTDNPSAQNIEFYIRVSGSGAWSAAGLVSNTATAWQTTNVAPNTAYDVGVAYQVNGTIGAIQTVATNISTGGIGTATGPGAVVVNTSTAGTGSVTMPAGSYAHAKVEIWGEDGASVYSPTLGTVKAYGGAGGYSTSTISVTPGTTAISWNIDGTGAVTTATCSSPSLSLSANAGNNASGSTPGTGGTASGGTTNTTGATGGAHYPAANGRVQITAET